MSARGLDVLLLAKSRERLVSLVLASEPHTAEWWHGTSAVGLGGWRFGMRPARGALLRSAVVAARAWPRLASGSSCGALLGLTTLRSSGDRPWPRSQAYSPIM